MTENFHPLIHSPVLCCFRLSQQPGASPASVCPCVRAITTAFPRHNSRKLDLKWTSWDSHWHLTWALHAPCENIIPWAPYHKGETKEPQFKFLNVKITILYNSAHHILLSFTWLSSLGSDSSIDHIFKLPIIFNSSTSILKYLILNRKALPYCLFYT